MTQKSVWHILAAHDLRRTCARLCHASGGELEQIQFLLGHVSVQTTERYLGCKQRIQSAVNDRNRHRAPASNWVESWKLCPTIRELGWFAGPSAFVSNSLRD
jgi:integrase